MTQNIDTIFSREEMAARIAAMGREISADYEGKPLTLIVLMTGGMIFAADLARTISIPLWIDSLSVSSYHGHNSTGKLKFRSGLKLDVKGRHVLLIDEVFDTGVTMTELRRYLEEKGALSIRAAVAVVKDIPRSQEVLFPEYAGFYAPDRYLIGYGLDSNEEGRHLPFIGAV